ncbi:MAG: hypothetical protein GYB36_00015 [Alphaproteobacteria bacterium]|nr:hypothetical protein [Alphaproteobacteria bacterium]
MLRDLPRLAIILTLLAAFTPNAHAQSVERGGRTYELVEFSVLASPNGAWGWEIDGPSLFAGRHIVTLGWLNSGCYLRQDGSISNPEDQNGMFTADPAQLRLWWGDYTGNRYGGDHRSTLSEDCYAFVEQTGIGRPVEILVLIYGEVRNGSGRNQLYCNRDDQHQDYVQGCNHIIVHRIEFADFARDRDGRSTAAWNSLMADAIRLGGEAALRYALRVR